MQRIEWALYNLIWKICRARYEDIAASWECETGLLVYWRNVLNMSSQGSKSLVLRLAGIQFIITSRLLVCWPPVAQLLWWLLGSSVVFLFLFAALGYSSFFAASYIPSRDTTPYTCICLLQLKAKMKQMLVHKYGIKSVVWREIIGVVLGSH